MTSVLNQLEDVGDLAQEAIEVCNHYAIECMYVTSVLAGQRHFLQYPV